MKLFTEEQVRELLSDHLSEEWVDKHISFLTPIELPTWDDVKNAMNYASQITNNKLKYMDDYIEQLKQSKQ